MVKLYDYKTVGERIKYLRKIHGLSQAQLAKMVETTQQAIQQAEVGKAQTPRYLPKIAQLLEVPIEWLSLGIMPNEGARKKRWSMSERSDEVLNNFYAMPSKDQDLMLELMKSRKAKSKSTKKKK